MGFAILIVDNIYSQLKLMDTIVRIILQEYF